MKYWIIIGGLVALSISSFSLGTAAVIWAVVFASAFCARRAA